MASSFVSQIPCIINLISRLRPERVLDIGKGFGKYGFLLHEYVGIDNQMKIDPGRTMAEQSRIRVDAVEVDADLMLPHLGHYYNKVYFGDALELYPELPKYDLVMMIDIIEHVDKKKALDLLRYFLSKNTDIIVSTPIEFFEQHLYDSTYENHVSFWTIKDFRPLGHVDAQFFDAGAVYLLSNEKYDIRGFGQGLVKKVKRIARAIKNEL